MAKSKGKKAVKASRTSDHADRRARKLERLAQRMPKSLRPAKSHKLRDRGPDTAAAWSEPAPQHLVARLDVPKPRSKYHSYFEFAENTEKKKKLEFQLTSDPNPPPGFEFVPIGVPELTHECKELSRERDAMIFIVSVGRFFLPAYRHRLRTYRTRKNKVSESPSTSSALVITFVV